MEVGILVQRADDPAVVPLALRHARDAGVARLEEEHLRHVENGGDDGVDRATVGDDGDALAVVALE